MLPGAVLTLSFIFIKVDGHLPNASFFSSKAGVVSSPLFLLKLLENLVTALFKLVA